MARYTQQHRVDLLPNINETSFQFQQRFEEMKQLFISKGFSTSEAVQRAYQSMEGMITQQSTVLSYMDVFLDLGILFLVCVPFVLMIRTGKKNKVNASTTN